MRVLFIEPDKFLRDRWVKSIEDHRSILEPSINSLHIYADFGDATVKVATSRRFDLIICSCTASNDTEDIVEWLNKQVKEGTKVVVLCHGENLDDHPRIDAPIFSKSPYPKNGPDVFDWINQNFPWYI